MDHDGFKQAVQTFNLEVGQQAMLDLPVAGGRERRDRQSRGIGELLKTQDASVGAVVDQHSVDSLPLNGRMLIDLVLTVPGAHMSHGAATGDMNALYWRPGQRSAVSIGGSRPNANYFLLDGATNTDPTFSTQNFSASPDAVQEFQVETGSYSAEMGGAGGGQINIVTRTGSSHFHGTAYEFLRNGAMDAQFVQRDGRHELSRPEQLWSVARRPHQARKKTYLLCELRGAAARAETWSWSTRCRPRTKMPVTSARVAWTSTTPTTTAPNPNYNPSLPAKQYESAKHPPAILVQRRAQRDPA